MVLQKLPAEHSLFSSQTVVFERIFGNVIPRLIKKKRKGKCI